MLSVPFHAFAQISLPTDWNRSPVLAMYRLLSYVLHARARWVQLNCIEWGSASIISGPLVFSSHGRLSLHSARPVSLKGPSRHKRSSGLSNVGTTHLAFSTYQAYRSVQSKHNMMDRTTKRSHSRIHSILFLLLYALSLKLPSWCLNAQPSCRPLQLTPPSRTYYNPAQCNKQTNKSI